MDLLAARHLQALSLGFHIILVCFGVAFPVFVLIMEGLYLRTRDDLYRRIARRWAKAMAILFAVGVVSGTILSFELGILWPEFMRQYGAVFGFAFALEGTAFFVEAIFIAIYVYGWDRLSERTHFLSGLPIPIAGLFGSMFVISVNGWMNNPVGFEQVNGVVSNIRPLALFFNGFFWHEFVHMILAAFMVAGFMTASVYAVAMLRGRRDRFARVAMVVPLTIAALVTPVQLLVGDWAARTVAKEQPIKLAAIEGLGQTQSNAPWHLFGWYSDGEVHGGLAIPNMLSILAYHNPNATVQGLDSVPASDRPDAINVVRLAFQTMIIIGSGLALLSIVHLWVWWRRRRIISGKWFLMAVGAAGPAAIVALESGWITTEVGRQPWIVYKYMRTSDAVTTATGIPVAWIVLGVVYLGLMFGVIWALRRLAHSPEEPPRGPTGPGSA